MKSYILKRPVILEDKRQFAVLEMDGATLGGVAGEAAAAGLTCSASTASSPAGIRRAGLHRSQFFAVMSNK